MDAKEDCGDEGKLWKLSPEKFQQQEINQYAGKPVQQDVEEMVHARI
jgi:hypothetical protein